MITKMDKIWIATASMIKPKTSKKVLVTRDQIEQKISSKWNTDITPVMINKHLVSWEDRQADKNNPSRGGSRNRYLFRTKDGKTPSANGDFRLYKEIDSKDNGKDKNGKCHPSKKDIPQKYHNLVDWYKNQYK